MRVRGRPGWQVVVVAAVGIILLATVQLAGTPASASVNWSGPQFCGSFKYSVTTGTAYDGVQPCAGSYTGTVSYSGVTFDTDGWQCVELAARWFYAYTGNVPTGPNGQLVGSGRNVVSQFHAHYTVYPAYPASGGTATYDLTIYPGDIISMWGPASSEPAGHVAVVTNVNVNLVNGVANGTITVMDENNSSKYPHIITVSNGQMSSDSPGSYYYYNQFQWLGLAPGPSAVASVPGVPSWPRISTAEATDTSGRLEVFHVGQNGSLYHAWQTSPGSTTWSAWYSLGGNWPVPASIAVARNSSGVLSAFVIGHDGQLYQAWQTSPGSATWSGWHSLGGSWSASDSVAVAQNSDGRLEVFLIAESGQLYHAWQTSPGSATWSGWYSLGGNWPLRDSIAVARNSDGRLEVFLIGNVGPLYTAEQMSPGSTTWSLPWTSLGGNWPARDSVGLAVNQDGRLEVFLVGYTGQLYNAWQTSPDGTWSSPSWQALGGNWPSSDSVSVATNPSDGQMEVVLAGYTGQLYTAEQMGAGGSWTSWSPLGGTWPSFDGIAEAANTDGRLEVFLVGYNSSLYTAWQTQPDAAWSGWKSLEGSWW